MKLRNDTLTLALTGARREAPQPKPHVMPTPVETWACVSCGFIYTADGHKTYEVMNHPHKERFVNAVDGPALLARRKAREPGLMLAKCEAFYYVENHPRIKRARAQRANHQILHTIVCRMEVDNIKACAAERPLAGTIHLNKGA